MQRIGVFGAALGVVTLLRIRSLHDSDTHKGLRVALVWVAWSKAGRHRRSGGRLQ